MNHNRSGQPFLVADPHAGPVARVEQIYRDAVAECARDERRKRDQANAFMVIGLAVILVAGYLGWLLGR
jgi:hypothetical protein